MERAQVRSAKFEVGKDDTMQTAKPKLLIIEDEPAILEGLTDVFLYNGYDVVQARDGREGLELALSGGHHLILLDIMLPGIDGFAVCNRVREVDRQLPIIMLTARTSEEDIIKGLKLGADDYVPKPFSIRELLARVEAALRRSGRLHRDMRAFHVGDMVIHPERLCGSRDGVEIAFTSRELEILVYLDGCRERPISRQELLREVWGYSNVDWIETRTVDIHITKLRRKIEPDPAHPELLITVRGKGYQLKAAP